MAGRWKWRLTLTLGLIGLGILMGSGPDKRSLAEGGANGEADDGWRRTAQGWERIDSWTSAEAMGLDDCHFDAPDFDPITDRRSDFHPVILAGSQTLVVALGLLALQPTVRRNGGQVSASLHARRRSAA
jgi:hypothetical protein